MVTKELIINSSSKGVEIALLEDKKLAELHHEKIADKYAVGDIYLAKVKKILPGLNASFIDVGYKKDAFLHFLDLGKQILTLNKFVRMLLNGDKLAFEKIKYEESINKTGEISHILKQGDLILVQIAKEPISTKGPRVTTEISFAGRYVVLVPFEDRISVSQKIKNPDEKKRLRAIVQAIKPKNFGVIIRTIAEKRQTVEIENDIRMLMERWNNMVAKLPYVTAPYLIAEELSKTSVLIRDLLNDTFNHIYVSNSILYQEVKNYIKAIDADKEDIVKLYKNKEPIFDYFGVTKQIKASFGKVVTIKGGIYLIIEHTEALHVIDVNSGHRVNTQNNQEQNALEVNIEAAVEIARQLRLRDMGGIIVVDFIDLNPTSNHILYQKLKEAMTDDKAKHTILPPTKFGLVQITRHRVRPEMNIEILEKCPSCGGTGKVKPTILMEEEIEKTLDYLILRQSEKKLTIALHPYICAYLKRGFPSIVMKWCWKYKQCIHVMERQDFQFLEFRVFSKTMDEINLWTASRQDIDVYTEDNEEDMMEF